MADEDTEKTTRTSKEQIECYLAFMRSHPELQLNKNDPTRPKRIQELWIELAEQLNALKGPIRTPNKWKESLAHWKNQVRSRARKAKADRLVTGGGPCLEEAVTERDQRALDTLGSVVVDGMADIPNVGAETEILISYDPGSPSVESTDPLNETPATSLHRKTTSDKMFGEMMTSIKERNEEERKFREQSLKCMEHFSNSMNNMASAILSFSQAMANKNS
ncbi:uncharacterized protein LOC118736581 isoform X1 [Rhagoletis pomonella]|uniref:uncharacterized protein LOC118736581 isoform X1 n=2 Tax=Rhagoletis TaxID=28609 RepID=UPI00177AEE38|nr:uncharacterized protein LOC118736581 isoform X1 [Rhagoletis pomonella]